MKIAIKKIDILPAEPIDICGYGFSRGKSKECEDEIAAVVCVLDDGDRKFAFVSIDTCYVNGYFTDSVRLLWEKRFGIQRNCIIIAATHTHSGPGICHCPADYLIGTEQLENMDYVSILTEKLTSTVKLCMENMQECELMYGFTPVEQCFGNRNHEHGDYLKESVIWKIKDAYGREIAAIVHLNSHSTVLKGNYGKLSSDLVGCVRMQLEKLWEIPVMIFMGAAGDISTKYYVKEPTQDALVRCATKICDQLNQNIVWTRIYYKQRISNKTIRWKFEYSPKENNDFQLLRDKCEEKYPFMLENMMQIDSCEKISIDAEVQIYTIGDMKVVCLPGELLTKFARSLEKEVHGKIAFICCANDYWQYFVPQEEFGDYFESYNSIFPKGEGDKLLLEVQKQLSNKF